MNMSIPPRPATIAVTVRPAPAPWNADLERVRQALTERLAAQGRLVEAAAEPDLLITIGQLGRGGASWAPEESAARVLPIHLVRAGILCGPFYHPAHATGPCPHCLERRWRLARHPDEQRALAQVEQAVVSGPSAKLTPFALDAVWHLLSGLLDRPEALLPSEEGIGAFYELRLDSLQVAGHALMVDSLCPFCTTPQRDNAEGAQLRLQSRPKQHPTGYRLVNPLDYDLPLKAYLNPVCGMFGAHAFTDYTGSVTAPVSGHFMVENKYKPFEAWWGGHASTYRRSERVGLLEALERYAGLRPRGREITVFDSYANLAEHALNPLSCGVYGPEYYAQIREHAEPFTPDRKLHWVWGYSLRRQRPILVPEELVYYLEYRPESKHFVRECSNGCATGSTIEEAALFGLLELIERDAFLLMWYARLAPPRIDPASCRNPDTIHVLNRIDRLGYDIHLFDTRMDIRVPSVTAVALRRDGGLGSLVLAAGASLDPEQAIRSAVGEIGSYLPDFVHRTQHRLSAFREMAQDYRKVTQIDHHAPLYGLPEMLPQAAFMFGNPLIEPLEQRYADWHRQYQPSLDLKDDLQTVATMLFEQGLDVIIVDQSAPETARAGITVACTIVPGLLPMEFGFTRRRYQELPRLRTAPRLAGYLDHDFDPAQANTVPHPFP